MKLKTIMFVGTGSDVGKSIINAAFCRIFKQDGYKPAPFKAQNMSLNSYATPDGYEIGRAQAVQAEACKLDCMVEMNPVLLKPTSNQNSQVVLNGKPIGNKSAKEYFLNTDRDMLFKEAMSSFWKLEKQFSPVVVEGAGSISEMNLWDKDITNMRVALEADAATYLIADIDRGGVFASVYGSLQLLPEAERKLVKGIVINKFRGDIDLFSKGKEMLEELTGIPVVSIIPYYRDIFIDDEDSVVLDKKIAKFKDGKINIAVVLLRHMSNFTDFNVLERIPEVHLFYTHSEDDILNADIVIIPGSKNTIEDLLYLQKLGLAQAIVKTAEKGNAVYGICGGYQMMGEEIADPEHVEGDVERIKGLGLLPVKTILTAEKTTEQCNFTFKNQHETCKGYEIHMGETETTEPSDLCILENGKSDGYYRSDKIWGSYIHGIFDNLSVIKEIVRVNGGNEVQDFDIDKFKDLQYDKLANLVRENSDMDYIYKTLME